MKYVRNQYRRKALNYRSARSGWQDHKRQVFRQHRGISCQESGIIDYGNAEQGSVVTLPAKILCKLLIDGGADFQEMTCPA